jgi:hypothetical protein
MAGLKYGAADLSSDLVWRMFDSAFTLCRKNLQRLTDRERKFIDEMVEAQVMAVRMHGDERQFGISSRQVAWVREIAMSLSDGSR